MHTEVSASTMRPVAKPVVTKHFSVVFREADFGNHFANPKRSRLIRISFSFHLFSKNKTTLIKWFLFYILISTNLIITQDCERVIKSFIGLLCWARKLVCRNLAACLRRCSRLASHEVVQSSDRLKKEKMIFISTKVKVNFTEGIDPVYDLGL